MFWMLFSIILCVRSDQKKCQLPTFNISPSSSPLYYTKEISGAILRFKGIFSNSPMLGEIQLVKVSTPKQIILGKSKSPKIG